MINNAQTRSSPPRAYSTREVADALGVHETTIRLEVMRGRLHAIRIGRLLRIPSAALIDYLEREHVEQRAPLRPRK
ncbi:MAG: helix-turn-helix domain-containing protein [Planctomycetes bacterium]|nr:helix-turn-helix domain-containing protein [Planctomycetota bacterium]